MLSAASIAGLSAIAIVAGVALLWIFRRFSNRERVTEARRQARARLYAMRLYGGEPLLVFRALRQLLAWNGRYLLLMLPSAAIALVPGYLLYTQLDRMYSHRPLAPGESAVVTARFDHAADLRAITPALEASGAVVETPVVRLPTRHEACWRIRALNAAAGRGLRINGARSIEIVYPATHIRIFGYGMPWLLWFVAVSLAAALVASRRPWATPHL